MVDFELIDEIAESMKITKVKGRGWSGTWVKGTIHGHRFDALVFPEHAVYPEYELERSRISKLWLQRISDKKTVFNWDRGMDIAAKDATVQAIVDFLCAGLAEYIFEE